MKILSDIGGITLSEFHRKNLEETLKIIKAFSLGVLKPTQFSQAIGGRGPVSGSTFNTKYADLKFYGLVERVKDEYKFTDICKDIKEAKFPQKEKDAKIKAFLYPSMFRTVYQNYRGAPIEFNASVIEEIANIIRKTKAYMKQVIDVFVASGVYAGVIEEKPNNRLLIKNVDAIVGSLLEEQEDITPEPKKDEPDARRRKKAEKEPPPTGEVPTGTEGSMSFSINLNLDGSTTPELADRVFAFLREAGVGKKKADRLELHVTQPPLTKDLLIIVEQLIKDVKEEILIVTPYLDNQVLNTLIPRAQQDIKVKVITRPLHQLKGKEPKAAWNLLAGESKIDHRCYDMLHSRMIIMDRSVVLVSSADISHDSLEGQFNAGILTDNPTIVRKSIEFIEALLKKTKKSKSS